MLGCTPFIHELAKELACNRSSEARLSFNYEEPSCTLAASHNMLHATRAHTPCHRILRQRYMLFAVGRNAAPELTWATVNRLLECLVQVCHTASSAYKNPYTSRCELFDDSGRIHVLSGPKIETVVTIGSLKVASSTFGPQVFQQL